MGIGRKWDAAKNISDVIGSNYRLGSFHPEGVCKPPPADGKSGFLSGLAVLFQSWSESCVFLQLKVPSLKRSAEDPAYFLPRP